MEMIKTFRDEKQATSVAACPFDSKRHLEPKIDASLR
jgi:hypothetical protein